MGHYDSCYAAEYEEKIKRALVEAQRGVNTLTDEFIQNATVVELNILIDILENFNDYKGVYNLFRNKSR